MNALFAVIFAVVNMLDRQRVSKRPNGFTKGDAAVSPVSSGLFFIQLKASGDTHTLLAGSSFVNGPVPE